MIEANNNSRTRTTQTQCALALARALKILKPEIMISDRGYVSKIEDNLLPDIDIASFEANLLAGAGAELRTKFLAAHSSAALAVNCFAPFRNGQAGLDIGRNRELSLVGFEQKFPTGLARAEPPHLDVVATGPSGLLAVESKCTEYLSPKAPKFSERYQADIVDERASGPWFAEMVRLKLSKGGTYRFLDVAQLIKHAFGLALNSKSRPAQLVYLYWEPTDAVLSPVFAEHRAEISAFAKRVAGGNPSFSSMSYADLWDSWSVKAGTDLSRHVRNLRSRYQVTHQPK
jgi:hypothetical protein